MKYRIRVVESERGWGQDHWSEDYDTYEEAAKRIKDINAQNTASGCFSPSAPDWYMQADEHIEAVEIVK
jgi:hypothetical protein